jgi:hypothetical protein
MDLAKQPRADSHSKTAEKKENQYGAGGGATVSEGNGRMKQSEIKHVSQALRARVKAARATIIALGPKLKANFEVEVSRRYPARGDAVWLDAMEKLDRATKEQRARVAERCEELGIPHRFRPTIAGPHWSDWHDSYAYKSLRAELCRVANLQIDDMLKTRLAEMERDSADIQFEIASQGCLTDAAKEFMAKLPSIDALIPAITMEEVQALIEGWPTRQKLAIPAADQAKLKAEEDAAP